MFKDVYEVYIKDTDSKKQYFYGVTTKNDISQKLKQDSLRGGIGWGIQAIVQSEKEITFKVDTLFHNDSIYSIQSGKDFIKGTKSLQFAETVKAESTKIAIKGTAVGTSAIVVNSSGQQAVGVIAVKDVTVAEPALFIKDGEMYKVLYTKENTEVEILDLAVNGFPKSYYVELHTIGYNPKTNKVAVDAYWVFPNAMPDGAIKGDVGGGNNSGDEMSFTAMANGDSYGEYIVIPRV